MEDDIKVCTKCLKSKPLDAYHNDKTRRDGKNPRCKVCAIGNTRAWKEANKTAVSAYYEKNKERARVYQRAYRQANAEKLKKNRQARKPANPQKQQEYVARWRKANPDKTKLYAAVGRLRNPEARQAQRSLRRARARKAEGRYTSEEFKAKVLIYQRKCHWCFKTIAGVVHADHLIPLARGGSNDISNIVPSCAPCNLSKGAKLPHEFMGRLF